ncbi:hypothetical protein Bca52824_047870 [Brassica carinata]|uniref:Pre-mRNA-processing factor 19 n=1 Tax=Brassica carinata TaxID=52824 RepID=A0A8X7RH86_BRACI|nr:hypothetical protein Bca52824_047870 [Brassica carinata]
MIVRIWGYYEDGNYACGHILKDHSAEVRAVTVHSTNKYFVSASLDSSWCFYDMSSGLCLLRFGVDGTESSSSSFLKWSLFSARDGGSMAGSRAPDRAKRIKLHRSLGASRLVSCRNSIFLEFAQLVPAF